MFERLLTLIQENLPDADLSKATKESRLMEDLGLDSVGLMMLSMSMEDEFGVEFTDAIPFITVQDVLDYLKENATK